MVGPCYSGTVVQPPGTICIALKRPTFGCAIACESGKPSGLLVQGCTGLSKKVDIHSKRIADSPGLQTVTMEAGRRWAG